MVVFYDNNIGGNPQYLRSLCDALEPLDVKWARRSRSTPSSIRNLVRAMSRSGCRFLYVGLESFNQESLNDMRKYQNAITQDAQDDRAVPRTTAILVMSGLMLSPQMDDLDYLRSIPGGCANAGLYVPSYVCFETPIPGTPHFQRLAAQPEPALLPNALLRDFNTYTLVVRPRKASVADFVDGYKWIIDTVYTRRNRIAKLGHDLPRLLRRNWLVPALLDLVDQYQESYRSDPNRSYIAGSDREPPESLDVPLASHDFDSEAHCMR
jgi:hypothetical protein